jgi:hypothetical protein
VNDGVSTQFPDECGDTLLMKILELDEDTIKSHSQNMVEIVQKIDNLTDLEVYQLLSYVAKHASYVSMDRVTVIVETPDEDPIANITYELGGLIK